MGDSPSDTNPYWARDGNFRTLAASDGLLIGGLPFRLSIGSLPGKIRWKMRSKNLSTFPPG